MTRHETRHGETSAQDLRQRVGSNIEIGRRAKKLTNRELAGLVDIDVRLLQKHKAGDNMPSDENLLRYARVLDRPVSWFFEQHGEEPVAA
jgi:transcriptional regulator with XRE-family HTH domain